jgi:hypothetical protein
MGVRLCHLMSTEGRRRLLIRGCGDQPPEEHLGRRGFAHGGVDVLASWFLPNHPSSEFW